MEHILGYAWGAAVVVAMFSFMAMMFVVQVGLLVGAFMSLLAFFVRPLRPAVPYLLLMPMCAAVAGWGAFLGYFNLAGRHLDMDQVFRAMFIGPFACFTLGSLLGAALGWFLARPLSRRLQPPTIPFAPLHTEPAVR